MQWSQVFNKQKNSFLHFFHHQFSETALETQIKAYAAFANVQHTEKRVFALFSSPTFENCLRNAKKWHMQESQMFNLLKKRVFALFSSSI